MSIRKVKIRGTLQMILIVEISRVFPTFPRMWNVHTICQVGHRFRISSKGRKREVSIVIAVGRRVVMAESQEEDTGGVALCQ